jgi:hypothetical protein
MLLEPRLGIRGWRVRQWSYRNGTQFAPGYISVMEGELKP